MIMKISVEDWLQCAQWAWHLQSTEAIIISTKWKNKKDGGEQTWTLVNRKEFMVITLITVQVVNCMQYKLFHITLLHTLPSSTLSNSEACYHWYSTHKHTTHAHTLYHTIIDYTKLSLAALKQVLFVGKQHSTQTHWGAVQNFYEPRVIVHLPPSDWKISLANQQPCQACLLRLASGLSKYHCNVNKADSCVVFEKKDKVL